MKFDVGSLAIASNSRKMVMVKVEDRKRKGKKIIFYKITK